MPDKLLRFIRRRGVVVLGFVAVMPLVMVDPAAAVLLLDVELLALLGSAGLGLVREDLRMAVARCRCAPSVVLFAAGVRLSREDPRSILAA